MASIDSKDDTPQAEMYQSFPENSIKYIEAAKINQGNLWKRRQIEWKTSFSLWTALATVTGFIYLKVDTPTECPMNWIFFILILIVYLLIVYLQRRFLRGLFVSNERDTDFINYYLNKAAWELNNKDLARPNRPPWADKKPEEMYTEDADKEFFKRKRKLIHIYIPLYITILIELFSLFIFGLKYNLFHCDIAVTYLKCYCCCH